MSVIQIKRIDENDISVLVPGGDLRDDKIKELDKILNQLNEDNITSTALDMSKVGYIYSKGVGVLVKNQKRFKKKGGGLYLYNLQRSVQRILMKSNLVNYLNVFSSRDEVDFELNTLDKSKDDASLELGLQFKITSSDEQCVCAYLGGTIDSEEDMRTIRNEYENLHTIKAKRIELNITDLIYMDDQAALDLVEFNRKMKLESIDVVLKSANDIILDQLNIMGVKDDFPHEP